ncbi:MAG: hypothetical protein R3B35_05375 [Gemmatimonadales bacterium]
MLGHAGNMAVVIGVAGVAAWAAPRDPAPARPMPRGSADAPRADCRVSLHGTGSYRLTVQTGGPVPVVEFKGATGPRFDPISHYGNFRDCDQAMGALTVRRDRSVTPLLFHVANELYHAAATEWRTSQRPQIEYAYRDFGNLASEVSRDMLLMGFRQTMASIATDLILRYANPAGYLTDKGAKWVAETAVRLMMEAYVEGKDPGLIIDGLLTRMVDHLKGHAETLAGAVGGDALKEALKPQLTQIAGDVTKLMVEAQPDGQTVDVTGADNGNGCTHFLQIIWNFKGGTYRGNLTVTCGRPPSDWISRVSVANATVEPGEAGSVTAQALSQLGVPMPLATATSTGIAAVQSAGAGEPAAVLAGPLATFDFKAAEPRADKGYDVAVNLITDASTGRMAGLGRGTITVKNVAPETGTITPGAISAKPGDDLDLGPATWVVVDRNADASNPGEVAARTLTLAHPAGLATRPLFDRADAPRRIAFDGSVGRYEFGFTRKGRVDAPHPHGTWPLAVTIADEALTTTATIDLTVEDVAPDVSAASTTPQFVHRNAGKQIMVALRVTDPNGFGDITGVSVDATAAGGGVATLGNGLTVLAQGPDWIDLQLAATFPQTNAVGQHWIPVTVTDEAHTHVDSTFLHVGNLAPEWRGHGFIFSADSMPDPERPDELLLVPPKGLCPNDQFRVGVIASDPENDSLVVTATILETGASFRLQHGSDRVWVGDMHAPDAPGTYTVELKIAEDPADKETTKRHVITVIPCDEPKEDREVGLAVPGNAPDIAAAPRDPSSQLMLGAIAGGIVGQAFGGAPTPAGGEPGPSAAMLADSLAILLGEIEGTGLPPVETYVLATGGSTGPVAQMFSINRGPLPLQLVPQAVVLEPVTITPAIQSRVTDLLQRYIAAGGQAEVLNAYCLEFLRKPPAAGTLMRIASADVAAPFGRYASILDAAERVRDGVGLSPDSDPTEYFHAIRQWSIWTVAERFDADGFAEAFVSTTRRNLEATGERWTDDLETAVRGLAPNRWSDVQAVLREAGLEPR